MEEQARLVQASERPTIEKFANLKDSVLRQHPKTLAQPWLKSKIFIAVRGFSRVITRRWGIVVFALVLRLLLRGRLQLR